MQRPPSLPRELQPRNSPPTQVLSFLSSSCQSQERGFILHFLSFFPRPHLACMKRAPLFPRVVRRGFLASVAGTGKKYRFPCTGGESGRCGRGSNHSFGLAGRTDIDGFPDFLKKELGPSRHNINGTILSPLGGDTDLNADLQVSPRNSRTSSAGLGYL